MVDPVVSMNEFEGSNATAVRIEPGEDARILIPHLDRLTLVEIAFPKFRDGRGYSSAQILREAGYKGELRAAGDVLVDQVAFMKRCGFDSFAPDVPLDPVATERALSTYDDVYQGAADAAVPIWKLRHG
jgi:uncharacterized protein (DUF934 family)